MIRAGNGSFLQAESIGRPARIGATVASIPPIRTS